MAQTDAKLAGQDGRVVALKRVSESPGSHTTSQGNSGFSSSITEPSGAFYGARFKPAPETPISNRKAVDPVLLTGVTKSGSPANGWTLHTTWSGGTAPYTVVSSTDPSFQINVVTNAAELPLFNLDMKVDSFDPGKFFNVVDGSTVSPAVQGSGLDPLPSPKVTSASTANAWWGDPVTLTGQYFDPIAGENLAYINDLGVRASSAAPPASGSSYSTSVTFEIPEDARSFLATVYLYGKTDKTGAPPIFMAPPGIGPYSTIKGVSFSPQNGHVWVAAQGVVEDVDLFNVTPTAGSVGAFVQPYISRVTTGGKILVIDRDSPLEIKEIDVAGHALTTYAWTADDSFTRTVDPVGLAVDPDGSVAYVADGGTGRVVRVPRNAGPGSSEITDQWGGRSFSFVDPVGIDVAPGHQVIVADNNTQWTWQLTSPSSSSAQHQAGQNVHSIEVDRGVSAVSYLRYVIDTAAGMTQVFNRNPIGTPAEPRYHGGRLYGLADGTLRLNYDWIYGDLRRGPKRVLLSNAVSGYPYPTQFQNVDRVIELKGEAWYGVPIHLRLIDPPDLAPYAPDGGWNPSGDPDPPDGPYEGNDNVVWGWAGGEDYGLSVSPTGPWYESLFATPGADNTYTYYLKVPPDVSGENFQVEITKCDPGGTVLQDQVVGMSGVYTSWKRIFVERDKMFRKGGVLAEDYVPVADCGSGSPMCVCSGGGGDPPCCSDSSAAMCNQLLVYEWQNAAVGDQVAVFDEVITYETAGEYWTVTAISDPLSHGLEKVTLNSGLDRTYLASIRFELDSGDYQPTFTLGGDGQHHSAGYGVISGCDLAPNQINQTTPVESCYYEADIRGIERPFGDAFVEFRAPRNGMSVLPFVARGWFDETENRAWLLYLSNAWFAHYSASKIDLRNSYFHLMGATILQRNNGDYVLGTSMRTANFSYIFRLRAEVYGDSQGATAQQVDYLSQHNTVHETAHQFGVNLCAGTNGHDTRDAWCGDHCEPNVAQTRSCVMGFGAPTNLSDWDGINRFCIEDLFLGDPTCGSGSPPAHSIRIEEEPVKGRGQD